MNDLDRFQTLLKATRPPHQDRINDLVRYRSNKSSGHRSLPAVVLALIAMIVVVASHGSGISAHWPSRIAVNEMHELPKEGGIAAATPSSNEELTVLKQEAGFVPLLPAYLPSDCMKTRQFMVPAPANAITLIYSCGVQITEQIGGEERPQVGQGSSEQVQIAGKPGIYLKGAWVKQGNEPQPRWDSGFAQQLFLEQDGVTVHIIAPPDRQSVITVGGMTVKRDITLSKEEVFRIAASLQPVQ